MSKRKPLPCPFCGKAPYTIRLYRTQIAVGCGWARCHVQPSVHGRTTAETIKRWNTRLGAA